MAYDPAFPSFEAELTSAAFRTQFNGIADLDAATNVRIDNLPAGVSFPYDGDAEINGNLKVNGSTFIQGELALFESDGGGSGETGVRIGRTTAGGVQVPLISLRSSGSTIFGITLDFGGHGDGMGTPTIADGALWRYDLASSSMKPWNVIVRTIQAQDENGDPITLQVICPPP